MFFFLQRKTVNSDHTLISWEDIWLTPFFDVYVEGKAPIIENLTAVLVKLYPRLVEVVLDRSRHMPLTSLALKLCPFEALAEHQSIIDEVQWSTDEK